MSIIKEINPLINQIKSTEDPDEKIFYAVSFLEHENNIKELSDDDYILISKEIIKIHPDAQFAAEIAKVLIEKKSLYSFAKELIQDKSKYTGDEWSRNQFDDIKEKVIQLINNSHHKVDLKNINPKKFYYKIQEDGAFHIGEFVYGSLGTASGFDDAYLENGKLKHDGFPKDDRVINDHGCTFFYYHGIVYKFYIHIDSMQVGEVTALSEDEIVEEIPMWLKDDIELMDEKDSLGFIEDLGEDWIWIKDYFLKYMKDISVNNIVEASKGQGTEQENMFETVEDIPFNLDPFDLDISYNHGEVPSELEKYIDGKFFIELAKKGSKKFNIEFISFFNARTYFIYDWDGEKLTRIEVENAELYEEESGGTCNMYSSDDEIWNEAIGYKEVPKQAIDYADKNNLVEIIYSKKDLKE